MIGRCDRSRTQLPPMRVAASFPVVERVDSCAADRGLGLTESPRTTETVGYHHSGFLARGGLYFGPDPAGGGICVFREEADRVSVRQVGRVDAGVGTDPSGLRLDYQPARGRSKDLPALAQDEFDQSRVPPNLVGDPCRLLSGFYFLEAPRPPFCLGDDLLRADDDLVAARSGTCSDQRTEVVSFRDLRNSGEWSDLDPSPFVEPSDQAGGGVE